METRNLKYNRSGSIDMEINHPSYGWIPFTASANDSEAHGRELHAAAIAGELGAIAATDPPPTLLPVEPSQMEVLLEALTTKGIITAGDLDIARVSTKAKKNQ